MDKTLKQIMMKSISLSEHRVDMSVQLYADDDMFADAFKDFIDTYAPPSDVDLTGTPAEGFDFSDVSIDPL